MVANKTKKGSTKECTCKPPRKCEHTFRYAHQHLHGNHNADADESRDPVESGGFVPGATAVDFLVAVDSDGDDVEIA